MSNLFNAQGELNASSVGEALQTIAKIAAVYQDGVPTNVGLTPARQNSARNDELISRAMLSPEGKLALAQSMANPIK